MTVPGSAYAICSVLFFACASQSRLAPEVAVSEVYTPTDLANSLTVPYPPPPAKVETMPPMPGNRACVYWDGQWVFGPRDWQWVSGAWVIQRDDCAFQRSRLFWHTLGADRAELRYRPGRWVQSANPAMDCPVALPCPSVSVSP
ncbi:MAG TPA: hypothetical protein VIV60_05160 [Polyangiaceae bacterium]